jgi:hypothetical protein
MVHSPKQLEDHDRLTGAPDAGRIELPRVSNGGGTRAPAPRRPMGATVDNPTYGHAGGYPQNSTTNVSR